ncbi:MAG: HEAT repeat domain-containing protein [Anaerolineales bacterium]
MAKKNISASPYILPSGSNKLSKASAQLQAAAEQLQNFQTSDSVDDKLQHLQTISQMIDVLPGDVLEQLSEIALQDNDPRIRGEICYILGASGRRSFTTQLRALLENESSAWVQKQAKDALSRLEQVTPTATDYFQLEKKFDELAEQVERSGNVSINVLTALKRFLVLNPGDVKGIATQQNILLMQYYQEALNQAKTSFNRASRMATIGVFFFIISIGCLFLLSVSRDIAIVGTVGSAIGGTLVEVISGIMFYLYAKATSQLIYFQQPLYQMQRFVVANSICEALDGEHKQQALSKLVDSVATFGIKPTDLNEKAPGAATP